MQVIGIGKNSEDLEDVVVYKHLNPKDNEFGDILWVRPLSMFLEEVEVDGKKVKRFEFLDDDFDNLFGSLKGKIKPFTHKDREQLWNE